MTDVEFHYNAADPVRLAARLTAGSVASGHRVLVIAPEAARYGAIDKALWTHAQLSFVPHCAFDDDIAPETPVWLTRELAGVPVAEEVLINLATEVPTCFSRFETVIEIVGCDEADKVPGRVRYKFYLDRGYKLIRYDHQGQ